MSALNGVLWRCLVQGCGLATFADHQSAADAILALDGVYMWPNFHDPMVSAAGASTADTHPCSAGSDAGPDIISRRHPSPADKVGQLGWLCWTPQQQNR